MGFCGAVHASQVPGRATAAANMRAVWDAILYIAATGCQWAMLPKDFRPFTTVQYYFYRMRDSGLLDVLNDALVGVPAFWPVVTPFQPPGSSIANRSKPLRAEDRADTMRARKQRAASAIS